MRQGDVVKNNDERRVWHARVMTKSRPCGDKWKAAVTHRCCHWFASNREKWCARRKWRGANGSGTFLS